MFKNSKKVNLFLVVAMVVALTFMVSIPAFAAEGDVKLEFSTWGNEQHVQKEGDVTFSFEAGLKWLSYTAYDCMKSPYVYVDSHSTTLKTASFTIPEGKVFKSIVVGGTDKNAKGTVVFSSEGNPDVTFTIQTQKTVTVETGWKNPSKVVTLKIKNDGECLMTGFDDLVYGDPESAASTDVTTDTTDTGDASNPKTGDAGLISFGIVAITSASGMLFLRRKNRS